MILNYKNKVPKINTIKYLRYLLKIIIHACKVLGIKSDNSIADGEPLLVY